MQYFGVPTCPYCKKRVNLIRTWSLKRQGEYQCPRCGGISNIFLSPLIYVFALLAVFAGGAVYFFHKFVLDDISLSTVGQVLIPFAVFFLLSLFLVYLAKPVIKKIPKAELEKKRRKGRDLESRRQPAVDRQPSQMFYDDQDYLPRMDYRTGPLPRAEDDSDMKVVPAGPRKPAYPEELEKTSVVRTPYQEGARQEAPRQEPRRTVQVQAPVRERPRNVSRPTGTAAPSPRRNSLESVRTQPAQEFVEPTARRAATIDASRPASSSVQPSSPARRVVSVDVPSVSNEDFFAKYDDPEYVERRLRELKEERGE